MTKVEEMFDISRRELLDLSLKNPLINYKLRKGSGLSFPSLNASDVFNYLVTEGKKVYFTLEETKNPSKLYVDFDERELKRRLSKTYRGAKLHLEEKGANILFLALGFLKWKDNYSDVFYKAPLILVPVELNKNENNDRYFINYSGEEIRLNVSLITKLQNEFNVDIDYEQEDEIKNIDEYFRLVYENIKNKDEWEVISTEGAFDFFSYAKYLMYKDLDLSRWRDPETGEFTNEMLEKLFVTNFDDKLTPEDEILENLDPLDICNVVDADSSQQAVIYDINKNKNMVIQGPPGTGKSQTITNIIASSINKGKSILFVSEKKAALDVVKRRLENIGLGDLVLELHSEKTNKRDVLKSIENTVNLGEPKVSDDSQLNEKYNLTREQLNSYNQILNREVGNSRMTLSEIYGEALKVKEKTENENIRLPRVEFKDISEWDKDAYQKRLEVVREYMSLISRIGKIEKHPFFGVTLLECLPYEQVEIKEKLSDLDDSLANLVSVVNEIGNIFQNKSTNTIFDGGRLINSIDAILKYRDVNEINVQDLYLYSNKDELLDVLHKSERIKNFNVSSYKQEKIFKEAKTYVETYSKYYSLKGFKKLKNKNLKVELESYFKKEKASKKKQTVLYELLRDYISVTSMYEKLKYLFKDVYKGIYDTDYTYLYDVIKRGYEFLELISKYQILSYSRVLLDDEEKIERLVELKSTYAERKSAFEDRLSEFLTQCKFDSNLRFNYESWYLDMPFNELKKVIQGFKNNVDSIVEVVSYNSLNDQFRRLGLENLLAYYKESNKYEHLDDILSFEYFDSLINLAYELNYELKDFKEYKFERVIEIFKDLDMKIMVENIKRILKTHYDNMPSINENTKEMGILRREFQKRRNELPIRRLFMKASNTIQRIKPVFMMSPISIASFLPPNEVSFDLVVFDEASQVRPVEAFGALLRAKQIVVVGDSKQLPPTTFFDTMASKYEELDDEDYDFSNMESVLSLLLAKNIPERTLSWHYRSKNQSLITLSNNEFYNRTLKVFPSVNDKNPNEGLIFKYIENSYYARGTTRSNKIEAREVIKAVFEHAKNYPNLSLGVASFSLAQQEELYREFENRLKECTDKDVKAYFNSHKDEPFFIKNLESVQGDERDAIFISIGYGYDERHSITMDFGPLNKDGGERRLNVLITRAKVKCVVFSNITSHDINLSKTTAPGVVALKRFLAYAENRVIYSSKTKENNPDEFVDYLYQKLNEYDYEIDRNVGKEVGLDIAIYDKDLDRFTVGIECDGGAYKELQSATDRERIRRNVLKNLGWKIYHIWTPEFFRNPKNEFEKLLDFIQEAKKDEISEEKSKVSLKLERKQADKLIKITEVVPYKEHLNPKRRSLVLNDSEGLKKLTLTILKDEAPIHMNLFKKRLMYLTSVSKLNDEQMSILVDILKNSEEIEYKSPFIYLKDAEIKVVRDRSLLDRTSKNSEYISDEELKKAIEISLNSGEATNFKDICKVVSKLMGISKSEKLIVRLQILFESMLQDNKICIEDDVCYVNE